MIVVFNCQKCHNFHKCCVQHDFFDTLPAEQEWIIVFHSRFFGFLLIMESGARIFGLIIARVTVLVVLNCQKHHNFHKCCV